MQRCEVTFPLCSISTGVPCQVGIPHFKTCCGQTGSTPEEIHDNISLETALHVSMEQRGKFSPEKTGRSQLCSDREQEGRDSLCTYIPFSRGRKRCT